ncbi:hypothetical protein MKEN_01146100 [Mycena kentingensis (nom. inval.)]|nr:hypothetical protein MKEN_01146100 [Mycena kentingensis (nom. inval.)]
MALWVRTDASSTEYERSWAYASAQRPALRVQPMQVLRVGVPQVVSGSMRSASGILAGRRGFLRVGVQDVDHATVSPPDIDTWTNAVNAKYFARGPFAEYGMEAGQWEGMLEACTMNANTTRHAYEFGQQDKHESRFSLAHEFKRSESSSVASEPSPVLGPTSSARNRYSTFTPSQRRGAAGRTKLNKAAPTAGASFSLLSPAQKPQPLLAPQSQIQIQKLGRNKPFVVSACLDARGPFLRRLRQHTRFPLVWLTFFGDMRVPVRGSPGGGNARERELEREGMRLLEHKMGDGWERFCVLLRGSDEDEDVGDDLDEESTVATYECPEKIGERIHRLTYGIFQGLGGTVVMQTALVGASSAPVGISMFFAHRNL